MKKNKKQQSSIEKPTYQNIPIDRVLYDKNNPREYLYWIDELCRVGKIDKKEFNKQMRHFIALGSSSHSGEGYERVQKAVESVGFIIHPIICVKIKENKFVCIEGNTRLSIYSNLKLAEENQLNFKQTKQWDAIPALVFNQLTTQVINTIRMISHFRTGRDWTPGGTAKFIHEQLNQSTQEEIANITGLRVGELWDYKNAWENFEKYAIKDAKENKDRPVFKSFSIWIESASKGDIQETIVKKGGFKNLYKWIKENRFQRAEHIRSLPIIANSKEAWNIFTTRDSKEALSFLGLRDEAAEDLYDLIIRFEDRLLKWKDGNIERTGKYGDLIHSRLEALSQIIQRLFNKKKGGKGKVARRR